MGESNSLTLAGSTVFKTVRNHFQLPSKTQNVSLNIVCGFSPGTVDSPTADGGPLTLRFSVCVAYAT